MPEISNKRPLKVFLSYASQDKPIVQELCRRLVDEGWIDAWLDVKKLLPGQDWRTKIEEAVENSDIVIICLSSNSVGKEGFVQKELRYAREIAFEKPEETIFLIPLRLDDCSVPRGLKFYQWGDYFEEKRDDTYTTLLEALKIRHEQKLELEEKERTREERERQERDAVEKAKREMVELEAAHKKLEREATEKAFRENAEREAKERAMREKAKRRAAEKARRERAKRLAAVVTARKESLSKSFNTLKSAIPKTKPFLGIGVIGTGVVFISIWLIKLVIGVFPIPSIPTASTNEITPPREASGSHGTHIDQTVIPLPLVTTTPSRAPSITPTPEPVGGADKVALVANKEIWIMNVDGSDRKQVTFDGGVKSDLQWLSDGETIIFIHGKTIKYYNITTNTVDILAEFLFEASVDAFQVSHDGKMVMLAMSNEIFVVPFDLDMWKDEDVKTRSQVLRMEGSCILPTPRTPAALWGVQDARWSVDDELVAWLFKGNLPGNSAVQAEQVSVYDITGCDPQFIDLKDNFPSTRFDPLGYSNDPASNYELPDFDWDGFDQFIFNTSVRNYGWGYLYIYNWNTHKASLLFPNTCCYRDARWSPDGTYIFFEFQDRLDAEKSQATLYYIPVDIALLNGEKSTADFIPVPLPEGFFKDTVEAAREAAQPALRPAK